MLDQWEVARLLNILTIKRKLMKTIGVHYSGDVNTKVDVGEAVKEVT